METTARLPYGCIILMLYPGEMIQNELSICMIKQTFPTFNNAVTLYCIIDYWVRQGLLTYLQGRWILRPGLQCCRSQDLSLLLSQRQSADTRTHRQFCVGFQGLRWNRLALSLQMTLSALLQELVRDLMHSDHLRKSNMFSFTGWRNSTAWVKSMRIGLKSKFSLSLKLISVQPSRPKIFFWEVDLIALGKKIQGMEDVWLPGSVVTLQDIFNCMADRLTENLSYEAALKEMHSKRKIPRARQ